MYEALDIAKYIVTKCSQKGYPVTNVRLNQYLYYVQKHFLQECFVGIFIDKIIVSEFGVVIGKVYTHFSKFGVRYIESEYHVEGILKQDRKFIDSVIKAKKKLSFFDMINDICKKDGAWDKVYRKGKGLDNYIPLILIKEDRVGGNNVQSFRYSKVYCN